MCIPRTRAATQALRSSSSRLQPPAAWARSREGCKPHHIENIPESNLEMIRRVKYYERLAARGIVNRSRKDITECLTMHPLVGSYSLASKLTDEYIKLNAPYIGDWRD